MTAVHHNSNIDQDEKDFKVSKFDEAVCWEPNSFSSEKDPFESPLCVPQDALENLEWYNGFWGDFDSSLFNDFKFEIEQSSEGKFLDTHEEEKIKFEQSGEGKTQKDPFLDASNIIQNNHESQSKNQKKSNDFKFKFDESNEGKFVDTDHEEEEEEEEEEEIKFEQFAKGKTQKDQFLDVSNIQNNHESQSKNQKKLNDFKFELKQSSEGKFQEKIKLEQSSEGKTQKNPYLDASNIIQNNHESQSKNQKKAGFVKKRRTKTPREKNIFGGSWWDSGNDFEKLKENVDIINETGRRCSHCESKHTTQWRAGPLGRNTLCNACGLRFKSGRLLPEYRPAASPTFDESKYSNFHKRVLKKREYIIR